MTIVRFGTKFRVLSDTGKNLGTFPTMAAAEKHEREVKMFKHMKGKKKKASKKKKG